jgi:hypothetical protein
MLFAIGNKSILEKATKQPEPTSETRGAMPRCEINYDFDPKGEFFTTVASSSVD